MPDAPVDAFLRINVDDQRLQKALQGESVDLQAPGWFHVTNFSFSLAGDSPDDASTSGSSRDKTGNSPDKSKQSNDTTAKHSKDKFEVEMPMQVGSPALMKLCTEFARAKTHEKEKLEIKSVEIWVRRAGMAKTAYQASGSSTGSGQDWFLQITLCKVTICSYRTTIECQDSFSLSYETMQVDYYRSDPNTGQIEFRAPEIKDAAGNKVSLDLAGQPDPAYRCSCSWVTGKSPNTNEVFDVE